MRPARASAAGVAAGLGAGGVALWEGGAAAAAVAAVLAGALPYTRSRARESWLAAAGALLVIAPFAALPLLAHLLVCAHAFCAGRWAGTRTGLLRVAVMVGALELGAALGDSPGVVPALLVPAAGWTAGRALAERDDLAARLAVGARDLEAERDAHAELSVRYERARIASELHDIVAHALSVMVVQAGAGQRMVDRDPAGMAQTLSAIAGAAREAERDLGRLIALLGDDEPRTPAPDLALIEQLVDHAAASGVPVTLRIEGSGGDVPAPVAQLGYRVVQEGLTNALRHAPGAPVSILVRVAADALQLDVTNGPAPRSATATIARIGTGNGLRGLHERVSAQRGELETSATPTGGWRLTARMPTRTSARTG